MLNSHTMMLLDEKIAEQILHVFMFGMAGNRSPKLASCNIEQSSTKEFQAQIIHASLVWRWIIQRCSCKPGLFMCSFAKPLVAIDSPAAKLYSKHKLRNKLYYFSIVCFDQSLWVCHGINAHALDHGSAPQLNPNGRSWQDVHLGILTLHC